MRSIVSIVITSPETICDDYGRALKLAGISPADLGPAPVLLARTNDQPGFFSPPWQLEGVLNFFGGVADDGPGIRVFPIGGEGPGRDASARRDLGWAGVLEKFEGTLVPVTERKLQPLRVNVPLPALGAVLPNGFAAPPVLAGAAGVLLPTPILNHRWQLAGNVSLLTSLLARKTRPDKRIPRSEIIAEVMGLAAQTMNSMISVMDGVVWGVYGEDGKAHPLIRNVVLAGSDPVAVDAVAARLAGLDPRRMPWLQLCADRGLGEVDPAKIVVKGRADLLALDFQFPKGTFSSGPGTGSFLSWPGRMLGSLGRQKPGKEFEGSGWGRMLASYRSAPSS